MQTRNRSNDSQFFALSHPSCSTVNISNGRQPPVFASVTPVHPEDGCTRMKDGNCNDLKRGKADICKVCSLVSHLHLWIYQNRHLQCGFMQSKRFLYQMLPTRLLFPNPIRPLFLERRCSEPWLKAHVCSCRRLYPIDKTWPVPLKA